MMRKYYNSRFVFIFFIVLHNVFLFLHVHWLEDRFARKSITLGIGMGTNYHELLMFHVNHVASVAVEYWT